ncbi:hypothetical protein KIPB_010489 [Kipferlia bialata]|uniref:Uncharacterized protein n=1 Tax=Kipferlia bialata TaxID=797122 RepID=A0A391NPK0_9EUKA|nr:hypothetical protein KIPB_010489 [Kipferlia bialata]|eukprot:g10489.t1
MPPAPLSDEWFEEMCDRHWWMSAIVQPCCDSRGARLKLHTNTNDGCDLGGQGALDLATVLPHMTWVEVMDLDGYHGSTIDAAGAVAIAETLPSMTSLTSLRYHR